MQRSRLLRCHPGLFGCFAHPLVGLMEPVRFPIRCRQVDC